MENVDNTKTFLAEDSFLSDIFSLSMEKGVNAQRNRENPVVRFKTPEELKKILNFHLSKDGISHPELLQLCENVFENSVLTGHPHFFNQQYAGLDSYGVAANIILASMNPNGHTFEITPVFSMAEVAILKHMQSFLGIDGDATFCPGGTYSNMLATNMARIRKFPESKSKGIHGLPAIVTLCSEQAHYSAQKNSSLLGFGEENCISVKCDKRGKMIPQELERKIIEAKAKGAVPILVTATAGTTVLGAFDPFHEIADICKKYDIWLHIDGAWGGSALVSKKYRHLLDGAERCDSFAWNAHKMLSAPVQCSTLLLKEKGVLKKSHSRNVPYLFQEGKPYDQTYDLSRNLVQFGRRCDGFTLWLMWKARGDEGFERRVDRAMDNAQYLLEVLKRRPNFRIVNEQPEFTNISFWFIPPSMRGQKEDDEFFNKLGKIVSTVKLRMQKSGTILVGFTPVGNTPPFFRMTVINELVNHDDMDFVLDEIERKGSDL